MKIGRRLNLEWASDPHTKTSEYHCQIIDKNENFFWIDFPIDKTTNQTTYFPPGASVYVSFVGDDHDVYTFRATILQKDTLDNIPALLLRYPKAMERVQRRNHIRDEAALDIAVETSEAVFTSVTKDISGDGEAAMKPDHVCLPAGS